MCAQRLCSKSSFLFLLSSCSASQMMHLAMGTDIYVCPFFFNPSMQLFVHPFPVRPNGVAENRNSPAKNPHKIKYNIPYPANNAARNNPKQQIAFPTSSVHKNIRNKKKIASKNDCIPNHKNHSNSTLS